MKDKGNYSHGYQGYRVCWLTDATKATNHLVNIFTNECWLDKATNADVAMAQGTRVGNGRLFCWNLCWHDGVLTDGVAGVS